MVSATNDYNVYKFLSDGHNSETDANSAFVGKEVPV